MNPDDENQQQNDQQEIDGGQGIAVGNGRFTFTQPQQPAPPTAPFSDNPGSMARQDSFSPGQQTGDQRGPNAPSGPGLPTLPGGGMAPLLSDPSAGASARIGPGQYTSPELAEMMGYTRFPTEKVGLSYEDYLISDPVVQGWMRDAFGLDPNGRYYSEGSANGAAAMGHGLETWDVKPERIREGVSPREFISTARAPQYPGGMDAWNVDPISRADVYQPDYWRPDRGPGALPFRREFGRRF